jgi:hypothetical protein
MKTILKTVLAIGLLASSSFSLAEGRFVFREPLRGVDGQEYYGMSQSQVDDAIAEQERLAQIEADKAMCLNESTWMEEVEKTRQVYVGSELVKRKVAGPVYSRSSNRAYRCGSWDTGRYQWLVNLSGSPFNGSRYTGRTLTLSSFTYYKAVGVDQEPEESCQFYAVEKWNNISQSIYETETYYEEVTKKTENYDYCISKGYETA